MRNGWLSAWLALAAMAFLAASPKGAEPIEEREGIPGREVSKPPANVASLLGESSSTEVLDKEDLPEGLEIFFPVAKSLTLQRISDFKLRGFEPTRLVAELEADGIDQLRDVNGRSDVAILGSAQNPIVLRDDGRHGDEMLGDWRFTAIVSLDHDQLKAKASAQVLADGKSFPVFRDAQLVGDSEILQPFDLIRFENGEEVEYVVTPPTGLLASRTDTDTFERRVLMITDQSVINDPTRTYNLCTGLGTPGGVWTFEHVMTEMANEPVTGISPSTFVEKWLAQWLDDQEGPLTNNKIIPARSKMQYLIEDWREDSGGGALDLSIAPFRLLAINPRVDLRESQLGGGFDAGEARFIFGLTIPEHYENRFQISAGGAIVTWNGHWCALPAMTAIVEYGIEKESCTAVAEWASSWVALNSISLSMPSSTYNAALENLTEQFVGRNADPSKPNGSALAQIRTNEIALASNPGDNTWELREFRILADDSGHGLLESVTTKETPDAAFKETKTFDQFVALAPPTGTLPPVPLSFQGRDFLGARANLVAQPFSTHGLWRTTDEFDLEIDDNGLRRHRVALNTCDGCHGVESGTIFAHVDGRNIDPGAFLSTFLTGGFVADPMMPGVRRYFDDLAFRRLDILSAAGVSCLSSGGPGGASLALEDLLRESSGRVH